LHPFSQNWEKGLGDEGDSQKWDAPGCKVWGGRFLGNPTRLDPAGNPTAKFPVFAR